MTVSSPHTAADYASVSERPGDEVLPEALAMVNARYIFATRHVTGRTVVEVACGAGHGLGALTTHGREVIGVDITASLLAQAATQYQGRVDLVRADALRLPLRSAVIDSLILFEALYYLPDLRAFAAEARRVLATSGKLIACWANPEHYEFVRGSYTYTYPTASEMRSLLLDAGFDATLFVGFQTRASGASSRLRSELKRLSALLKLMPSSIRAKALLKRVFYGRLSRFPAEVTANAAAPEPIPAPDDTTSFRVVYVVASKTGTPELQ